MAAEGRDSLKAQVDLAPDIFKARQTYDPQYAQLNVDTLRTSLLGADGKGGGLMDLYQQVEPKLSEFAGQAATAQRTRDVADVEALGGRASAAFRAADPTAAALEDELAKQAMAGLQAGGALDPAMANQVSQSVRAAQAARGFGQGASDVAVEGLFQGREALNMLNQRRGFASDVAARRRASTVDPFQAILGRPATVPGMAQQAVGQGGAVAGDRQSFDPFSAYASDVGNTNYNGRAAANIANANSASALLGAGIGAASTLGGARIMTGGSL